MDYHHVGDSSCRCADLTTSESARLAQWRDVCTRFFFSRDVVAQRVLDHFENVHVDQIVIETQTENDASSHEVQQLITALCLWKCPVAGHHESYNDAVLVMERVKNEVRGEYHRQAARTNYDAFNEHVSKAGQSTNLDPWRSPNGLEHLIIRVHEQHYQRSIVAQSLQHVRVQSFVTQYAPNIGCHPFLAGLRRVLEWNLASPTVVAWRVSDAAFVESGVEFAHAAVKLLVQELNCGHHESPLTTEDAAIRHRVWYLDPYLSDYDIRQLLKLFPAETRLESRGTGTQVATDIHRPNGDGTHDEYQPFFQKWCVIL